MEDLTIRASIRDTMMPDDSFEVMATDNEYYPIFMPGQTDAITATFFMCGVRPKETVEKMVINYCRGSSADKDNINFSFGLIYSSPICFQLDRALGLIKDNFRLNPKININSESCFSKSLIENDDLVRFFILCGHVYLPKQGKKVHLGLEARSPDQIDFGKVKINDVEIKITNDHAQKLLKRFFQNKDPVSILEIKNITGYSGNSSKIKDIVGTPAINSSIFIATGTNSYKLAEFIEFITRK